MRLWAALTCGGEAGDLDAVRVEQTGAREVPLLLRDPLASLLLLLVNLPANVQKSKCSCCCCLIVFISNINAFNININSEIVKSTFKK